MRLSQARLCQAKTGQWYRFRSLPEEPLLKNLGVVPGQLFFLSYRYPLSGPCVISVERRLLALGEKLAKRIIVEEYEKS